MLRTVIGQSISSPSRRQRGTLTSAVSCLRAVILSSSVPELSCTSWAKALNCHSVKLSGRVKRSVATPFLSVRSAGMKKAVSEKLERIGAAAFSSLSFSNLARVGAASFPMGWASNAMSKLATRRALAPTSIIRSLL